MINAARFRFCRFFVVAVTAVSTLACVGAESPATEDTVPEEAEAELVITEATPLPELLINDAGAVLVTQEEVLRMIDAGTVPMILDVRTPEEFEEGHVPGAINISHDELADRLGEIEAAKEAGVIVYCRSGRRAGIAEELLLGQGFSRVQHLAGDMLAWLEAERPTEKQQ